MTRYFLPVLIFLSSFSLTLEASPCKEEQGKSLQILKKALQENPTKLAPFVETNPGEWINTNILLQKALSWPKIDLTVRDGNELRFTPYSIPGSHILLVIPTTKMLSKKRLSKLIQVSQVYNLRISAIWFEDGSNEKLRALTSETGGYFTTIPDIKRMKSCLNKAG